MLENTKQENRFDSRLLCWAALGTAILFVLVTVSGDRAICELLYIIFIVPLASLALLVQGFRKKGRPRLSILSMLVVFWAISAVLVANLEAVRTTARWLALSHGYKSRVLAQPAPENGELRHVEWDGWGWAGQDTTVFLVFDPTDSLSPAAGLQRPGKLNGIPCEVYRVRRLGRHWYTAQFYTGEDWGRCD